MGDLLIRNIPDAIRQSLAERAERSGRSVSDEVTEILGEELRRGMYAVRGTEISAGESLRSVFAPLTPEERDAFSAVMEDIEAERKKDLGRPLEDLE